LEKREVISMHHEQTKELRELQKLEFAALELNLYLDTHPEDQGALKTFNEIVTRLAKSRINYEEKHGPLLNFGFCAPGQVEWRWIEEPWPWEI